MAHRLATPVQPCQRSSKVASVRLAVIVGAAALAAMAALTWTDSTGTWQGRFRRWLRRCLARALPGRSYPAILLTVVQGRPPRPAVPDTVVDLMSRTLLHGATPLQRLTADKVEVAGWVDELIGPQWLPRRFAICESFDEIDFDALPSSYVIKASHGSGMTVFVRPPELSPPIRDGRVVVVTTPLGHDELDALRRRCERWLATDYGQSSHEPQYLGLPRRLIVEEDLCAAGDQLVEVSFFCVKATIVCARIRTTQVAEYLVDSAFRPLAASSYHRTAPTSPPPLEKAAFTTMANAALTLAEPFDFVRVDLGEVGGRLVFSELTHTPQGGKLWFRPYSFTKVFGRFWRGDTTIPTRFRSFSTEPAPHGH